MNDAPMLEWNEAEQCHAAIWHSEGGLPAPAKIIVADDRMTADTAYRLACEGHALLWRGDFQNARQLLQALARRIDRKPRKAASKPTTSLSEAFHLNRQNQARRARLLGMLLIPFEPGYRIPLRRAPEVGQACKEAYGETLEQQAFVASLRELQGLIGAHEWRKKGVEIPALNARIHPHYGVYSPIRGEYVQLAADAPLPSKTLAFDIGTGTGVLAAVLAKRGVQRIIATDQDASALACAKDNMARLGFADRVEIMQADLFPPGRAPLIVCNPPWIPARPASALDHAVYDPDSRMLRGFIGGLSSHLEPGGEGWLIMSDLAEHLGLRGRDELTAMIEAAGLKVVGRNDVRPVHPRASDAADPLHAARAAEVTSLWRLAVR
jgi:methylase of polypeptide subunit release factors